MPYSSTQPLLHDRVIETVETQENTHVVYPNAGSHRNACVTIKHHKMYPDIVLCDRETSRVEHVIEVETEASVSDEQAKTWALEARGPWQFWLLVPRATIGLASQLSRRHGVRAHIVPWSPLPQGIKIEWPSPVLAGRRTAWWK